PPANASPNLAFGFVNGTASAQRGDASGWYYFKPGDMKPASGAGSGEATLGSKPMRGFDSGSGAMSYSPAVGGDFGVSKADKALKLRTGASAAAPEPKPAAPAPVVAPALPPAPEPAPPAAGPRKIVI